MSEFIEKLFNMAPLNIKKN